MEDAERPTATPIAVAAAQGQRTEVPRRPLGEMAASFAGAENNENAENITIQEGQYGAAAAHLSPIMEASREGSVTSNSNASVLSKTSTDEGPSSCASMGTTVVSDCLQYPLSSEAIHGQLGEAVLAFRSCAGYHACEESWKNISPGNTWTDITGWSNVRVQGRKETPRGVVFMCTEGDANVSLNESADASREKPADWSLPLRLPPSHCIGSPPHILSSDGDPSFCFC